MRSLLDGITSAHIRLDPFPHVFVPEVMDPAIYAALSESFPTFAQIAWADESRCPPSNHRFQLSSWPVLIHPELPDVWKEFVALHSGPEFFAEVVALFRDYWPAALKDTLGGSLLGHSRGLILRDQHAQARILQDARCEINTPVTGGPSSSRGAHLDTLNRMYTGLLYVRHPEDDSEGGDLELFRWKNGPTEDIAAFQQPADAVEVVATIPYRPNQLVLFPQGIDALHGVSVRQPTLHTRRYVFISAEIAEDWLAAPTASGQGGI